MYYNSDKTGKKRTYNVIGLLDNKAGQQYFSDGTYMVMLKNHARIYLLEVFLRTTWLGDVEK